MSNGANGLQYMTAEQAGIVEDEFTPAGTLYKQDAHGQWVPAITRGQHCGANEGHSEVQAAYTPNDSSYHVVTPVLREMEDLKARLNQRTEYDPRTGELQYLINGPKRDALQKQYDHLLHHVLPWQMAQGAQADEWLAANPPQGSELGLRMQLEKQRQVRERAEAMTAEMEAWELAQRLAAKRAR